MGSIIAGDRKRQQIKASAYLCLEIAESSLIQSIETDSHGRLHVFYVIATVPGPLFEIMECGRRSGWRYGEVSGREPWNLDKYREAFQQKRRYGRKYNDTGDKESRLKKEWK